MHGRKILTHYDVLGISPYATDAAVREAYRALALRWHPDRNREGRSRTEYDKAERIFRSVSSAYHAVRTEPQRQRYNRYLLGYVSAPARRHQDYQRLKNWLTTLRDLFWPFRFEDTSHG